MPLTFVVADDVDLEEGDFSAPFGIRPKQTKAARPFQLRFSRTGQAFLVFRALAWILDTVES